MSSTLDEVKSFGSPDWKGRLEVFTGVLFLFSLIFIIFGLGRFDTFLRGSFLWIMCSAGILSVAAFLVLVWHLSRGRSFFRGLAIFGTIAIILFVWGGATLLNGIFSSDVLTSREGRVVGKNSSSYRYGVYYRAEVLFEGGSLFKERIRIPYAGWKDLNPGDRCEVRTRTGILGGEWVVDAKCFSSEGMR